MKESKKLERIFKGVANHRRIEIIKLIEKEPGITLFAIARTLQCNFKTISEHTRRLVAAGLTNKQYRGNSVEHYLSPYGSKVIEFMKEFSKSQEY